jgi:radical SAM protein with 4Fe4S-binding SPASM domain
MLETDDCCFRCGTFASVHFITSDGNIILCCNDTKAVNILGNIESSDYASMLENKLQIMLNNIEFDACKRCTDDYRWYTLWNNSY